MAECIIDLKIRECDFFATYQSPEVASQKYQTLDHLPDKLARTDGVEYFHAWLC